MNSHTFNLFKKAMGNRWRAYRPQFDWFKIEDIVKGTDPSWNELVELNPSLKYAIYEFSKVFTEQKMSEFRNRYGLQDDVIKEFFHIYVGYHPSFGLYLCSIGPYKGPKEEDAQNKFGYFTHRLASTDSYNLRSFLNGFLNDSKSNFPSISEALGKNPSSSKQKIVEGDQWNGEWMKSGLWEILDESDFVVNIQHRTGERRGEKQWKGFTYEQLNLTPEFMLKNDAEYARQTGGEIPYAPVIGIGSWIQLKPSGVKKIIEALATRHGQEDNYKQIVLSVAKRRGIPQNNIEQAMLNDSAFSKEVSDEYAKINPLLNNIFNPRRMGAQRADALTTPKQMIREMELKEEMLRTIVDLNTDDPKIISEAMNAKRKEKGLAKGKLTPEFVSYMLNSIAPYRDIRDGNGNEIGERRYDEILPEFQNDLIQARDQRGFDDLETTLRMSSLYVAGAAEGGVDPVTKAKLVQGPTIFEKANDVRNYNSVELGALRDGRVTIDQLKKGLIDQTLEDNESVQPQDDMDAIKVNKPSVMTPPEEDTEEEEDGAKEDVKEEEETLSRIIGTLEKFASDLRSNKQWREALRLHKMIKRYQIRIEKS
ncbi:MAG: hypothetical protein WC119_02505 [Synergistaceae bacterium]